MLDAQVSSWRFDRGEDLRHAFVRVAAAEIARARDGLEDAGLDRAEAVHRARRSFKKLRALLRLARPTLGSAYGAENRRWRNAGRLLAQAREERAQEEAFDKLAERCANAPPDADMAALREWLFPLQASAVAESSAQAAQALKRVVALLKRKERRRDGLEWPRTAGDLRDGLHRTQAALVKSFKAALKDDRPERLHEWRKRLKDHMSQVGLLRNGLPAKLKDSRQVADAVADLLGDERDLSLLAERLSLDVPARFVPLRDHLLKRLDKDRRQLRKAAFSKGRNLSLQKPSAYAKRLSRAWEKAGEHSHPLNEEAK